MIWTGSRRITDCKSQKQLFPHLVVSIDQTKVRDTDINHLLDFPGKKANLHPAVKHEFFPLCNYLIS